ncbi:MAG TPA: hypothetical protein VFW63_10000, partial [Acidimicrobiales bacterium]|nr:hypothetical protein [Acidimicrobiales bacterium]
MWDSTGPKGGLGAKFQRAIVSEIVGVGAVPGVKVGSRIDPLRIEKQEQPIYAAADPDEGWTLDPAAAKVTKGKPTPFDRKGASGTPGAPSKVNHGNVTPGIDATAGGVTVDHAVQTVVLSFAALRKLRFVLGSDGRPLPAAGRRDAEVAARTAIAALGVAAVVYQHQSDLDLRSRCLLVPEEPRRVELLTRDGAPPAAVTLDPDAVPGLLHDAVAAAAQLGLRWHTGDLSLRPTPKLCELVRRSRSLLATEGAEEGAGEVTA